MPRIWKMGRSLGILALACYYALPATLWAADPEEKLGGAEEGWVFELNGTDSLHDGIVDMVLDDQISVLGTNGSAPAVTVLLRLDLSGSLIWHISHPEIPRPADLHLLDNGDLAVAGIQTGQLIVSRFHRDTGDSLWTRQRTVSTGLQEAPNIAQDPVTGDLLVAASDQEGFLVARFGPDGEPRQDVVMTVGGMDRDLATAVHATSGGLVLGGIEDSFRHGWRTLKVDAAGVLQWQDLELGDIGAVFGPLWLSPQGDGFVASGDAESSCGVPQLRVWSLGADGERRWTFSPDLGSPCVGLFPVPTVANDERIVAAGSSTLLGAIRVFALDNDGALEWTRSLVETAGTIVAESLAIGPTGQVAIAGGEGSTPQTPPTGVVAAWDASGTACFFKLDAAVQRRHLAQFTSAGDLVVLSQRFVPGEADNIHLELFPIADSCAPVIFSDGFESGDLTMWSN